LSETEIRYLKRIFGNSIDYSKVIIHVDSSLLSFSGGRAFVEGNIIHMRKTWSMSLLVHEMTHVWQYQTGGWKYATDAIIAQQQSIITTGSDRSAYNWKLVRNKSWKDWNPEQQARAVEDYHNLLTKVSNKQKLSKSERIDFSFLSKKVQLVKKGQGAPSWSNVLQYIDDWSKYWQF
jgi:hypothetical protein